jgi:pyridoxal biosynthesis lyase PdxS
MTAIWNASAVTPLATDRIPVDVSAAGAPSRWTGQNIADINTIIGGTVTALGSIGKSCIFGACKRPPYILSDA